jgi:hypothetical protein
VKPTPDRILTMAHLAAWRNAVKLQRERVASGPDSTIPTDARFLAVAVRNVLRAAHMAVLVSPDAQSAIDRFDQEVPNAKDVRDVLEHFDKYAVGEGNLQKELRKTLRIGTRAYDRAAYFGESLVFTPDDRWHLYVGNSLALDLQSAAEAAIHLADDAILTLR